MSALSRFARFARVALASCCALACGGSAIEPSRSGDEPQACSSNADCEVVSPSCCDCGIADATAYKAVNAQGANEHASLCQGVSCSCPAIASGPDYGALYFVPTCRAGACAIVDLRATDITTCKTAADCVLRSGTSCCQGCGDRAVAIHLGGDAELKQLVCGTEPVACGHCEAIYTDLVADCVASELPASDQGSLPPPHCVVVATQCTDKNPCTL